MKSRLFCLLALLSLVFITTTALAEEKACKIPEYSNWYKNPVLQHGVDNNSGRAVKEIMYIDNEHGYIGEAKNLIIEYRFEDTDTIVVIQWFEILAYTENRGADTIRRVYDINDQSCTLKLEERYFLVIHSHPKDSEK